MKKAKKRKVSKTLKLHRSISRAARRAELKAQGIKSFLKKEVGGND